MPKSYKTGITATLRNMELGDSVVMPRAEALGITTLAQNAGIKVCQRKLSDTESRVWRIE